MPKASRRPRRPAPPAESHSYEPLCYFPPQPTVSSPSTQLTHDHGLVTDLRPHAQDKKRWIEFDFAFARDHFTKTREAETNTFSTASTAEERVKRWNEWADVEVKSEKDQKGRQPRAKSASKETKETSASRHGSRLSESPATKATHTADKAQIETVLACPDLAGLTERTTMIGADRRA